MVSLLPLAEFLISHRAPPQVADRGMPTRYGRYRGNQIPGADQNTEPAALQDVEESTKARDLTRKTLAAIQKAERGVPPDGYAQG